MKYLLLVVLIFSQWVLAKESADAIKYLPIQDAGRVKPFDTFAREVLHAVHGKKTYEDRPAHMILMTWILDPQAWVSKDFVEIGNSELKKNLKFDTEKKYFSFKDIHGSERLSLIMQELNEKRQNKEKLDPYFQAVQRLETQIGLFEGVARGHLLKIVPSPESDEWISIDKLTGDATASFEQVIKSFLGVIAAYSENKSKDEVKTAQAQLQESVGHFREYAQQQNPTAYPSEMDIKIEVHYNDFHPFLWTWIIYLLAAICVGLVWIVGKDIFYKMGWALSITGLLIHIYGFALRCYITQRPPVSNMYETVIWVAFGALVFAMVLEAVYKFKFTLFAGALVASFGLILSDMSPTVLDPSLQPLEPVLRSNFWLTIHVLTITISYAAFFLAFGLADIALVYYWRGEHKHADKLQALNIGIYRAIQIGVMFLGPGIILGGVWADYSWGRFWGWDPKETWALITFLGYLAILHGRLSGWIKQFGLALWSIITFSLVIMAWYGVNFVLGAGLHSYGFGAGGVEYVTSFIVVHTLFVLYVYFFRKIDGGAAS